MSKLGNRAHNPPTTSVGFGEDRILLILLATVARIRVTRICISTQTTILPYKSFYQIDHPLRTASTPSTETNFLFYFLFQVDLAKQYKQVNGNNRKQFVRDLVHNRRCERKQCVICRCAKVDCTKVGVVYGVQCPECKAPCIDETGGTLNVRIKEHLARKWVRSLSSPPSKRRIEMHDGNDFCVKCSFFPYALTFELYVSATKVFKAFCIATEKKRNQG